MATYIKLVRGGEVRKFERAECGTFRALKDAGGGLLADSSSHLTYVDSEGDRVTVDDERSFALAVNTSTGATLRIDVAGACARAERSAEVAHALFFL